MLKLACMTGTMRDMGSTAATARPPRAAMLMPHLGPGARMGLRGGPTRPRRRWLHLASWAALLLLAATLPASAGNAIFTLTLLNIDDYATGYVNGRAVLRCTYKQTCSTGIDRYLRRGGNHIRLEFGNKSSGYAWGYALNQGSRTLAREACGRSGRTSCSRIPATGVFKVIQLTLDVP